MLLLAGVYLPRLARSLAALTLALVGTACSLPAVRPLVAPQLQSGVVRPRTVAVLPPDLHVTVRDAKGRLHSDQVLNQALLRRVQDGLVASMQRRGYRVVGVLGHDGTVGGRGEAVIHPADLGSLRVEIEQVTSRLPAGPGYVSAAVSAELAHDVRLATGADASLYARGWVYIAPGDTAAMKAAKVIGITLLVLVMVGLIVILAAGGGRGGGGIGRAIGGAFRAAGKVAVKAAVKTAQVAGRVAVRVVPRALEAAAQTRIDVGPRAGHVRRHAVDVTLRARHVKQQVDAEQPPIPVEVPVQLPRQLPARSSAAIGISLVDNDSGSILWHARQQFHIEPRGSGSLERLIEHYLRELPRAAPAR